MLYIGDGLTIKLYYLFIYLLQVFLYAYFLCFRKFFERMILCNSLVWSCSVTGRSGLTYQEAEESEEKALKQLASFPTYLQKPILYLAMKTQRSRAVDLNDDVFVFARDRYFIGEVVDCITGQNKWAVLFLLRAKSKINTFTSVS